jgi:PAS domain-containing protein
MKQPLWEVLPELKSSRFYETWLEAESTGKTFHFQDFLPGRQQFVRFAVYPFSGGFTIYFVDITEQRKREQELFDLSLVASRTTNGVVIMNAQGEIEWVNDGFCRILPHNRV